MNIVFPIEYGCQFGDGYAVFDSKLAGIYKGARVAHWDAGSAIDWNQQIDSENPLGYDDRFIPVWGGKQWEQPSAIERVELRRKYHTYSVSQFLHGEQIAMLVRLVGLSRYPLVPCIQSKQFATVQAADEARHLEVFERLFKLKV